MSVCAKFQLSSSSRSAWKVSVVGGWWVGWGLQSHFHVKPNHFVEVRLRFWQYNMTNSFLADKMEEILLEGYWVFFYIDFSTIELFCTNDIFLWNIISDLLTLIFACQKNMVIARVLSAFRINFPLHSNPFLYKCLYGCVSQI